VVGCGHRDASSAGVCTAGTCGRPVSNTTLNGGSAGGGGVGAKFGRT
jgi:hypothetical protein